MAGARWGVALVIAGVGMTAARAASVPQLYGAAFEREDTGCADMTVRLFESAESDEPASAYFWNAAVYLSGINLSRTVVSARTGLYDSRIPRLAPSMQELAVTLPFKSSQWQIGAGYQPLRIRESGYRAPVATDDGIRDGHFSLNRYNSDRFLVGMNGITDYDSLRHFICGVSLETERMTGCSFQRTIDEERNYAYIDYTEYGGRDGRTAATAGIGYWRDFLRHNRPFKFIWLLEGYFEDTRQGLRYNNDIIPWLLSIKKDDAGFQYNVHADGYVHSGGGGRLKFILSDRYFPTLPSLFTGDKKRQPLFIALEQFGGELAFETRYDCLVNSVRSNIYPDGFAQNVFSNRRRGPGIGADHAFRLFLHNPLSNETIINHLFGRVVYGSDGRVWKDDFGRRVWEWNGTTDVWLGMCALIAGRVFIDMSYKTFTTRIWGGYLSSADVDDGFFDVSYEFGSAGVWMFGLRLLR